jgi:hypothetical protein
MTGSIDFMGFDRGTQRHSLGGLIISHSRGGDGVQTDLGWLLALLVLRAKEIPRAEPRALCSQRENVENMIKSI